MGVDQHPGGPIVSDETQPATRPDPSPPCGWVKLYHPSGALVTLPVSDPPPDYQQLFEAVTQAAEAGFLVTAPGLEEGEQRFDCSAVVARTKQNQDGTETVVLDLYEGDFQYRSLVVYLNDDEAERAFELASGMSLTNLPVYPAGTPIERGKNARLDSQYVVAPPRPFGVVCKANPKYNPDEKDITKRKPKRLFVRWAALAVGQKASGFIDRQQVVEILDLCQQCSAAGRPVDMTRFLAWLSVESVEKVARGDFEKARHELNRKLREAEGGKR